MNEVRSADPKAFRRALGAFTTGVTVVTARSTGGADAGLTANSFNSVSLDPPMVLWSIDKKSSSFATFMEAKHFAVHILSTDQEEISAQFTRKGIDRFAGVEFDRGIDDVPLLKGCSARFVCRAIHRYEGGDHIILVGEVVSFETSEVPSLVFHGGCYSIALKKDQAPPAISKYGIDWLGFLLRRAYEQIFTPVRMRLRQLGLKDIHYHILTTLGMGSNRSVQEMKHLMDFIGLDAHEAHFKELASLGLIRENQVGERLELALSSGGQEVVLELHAIGKASEIDAFRSIGHMEHQIFKNLLNHVISNTEKNLPEDWRKEKVWLENNVWGAPAPVRVSRQ